jgi:DNA-binding MarR family transcriptional regulator
MEAEPRDPDLGVLAGQLTRALQEELFERLAEEGHPDVRPRHGAVLAFLDRPGLRATELAARSGLHKQIVGTIVDELAALGYVRREPDPSDRRAKRVVPTERGLDEIARARAILAGIEERHRRKAGDERFAAFRETFEEIVRDQRGWKDS